MTWKKSIFRNQFLRFRHLMETMWSLFLRFQCFNKKFLTKSKKDTIYMGIIYTSSLSRNLLCKNIYTMSSFIMSSKLFNGIPSNSHSSSSSLSSFLNCVAKKSTLYQLACVSTRVWLFPLINGSISKNRSIGLRPFFPCLVVSVMKAAF